MAGSFAIHPALGVILLSMVWIAAALALAHETADVVLQPLGNVSPRLIGIAQQAVKENYGIKARVQRKINLPQIAFYPERQRYRADKLLDILSNMSLDGEKVVGLTNVDVSTTKLPYKDWGVFGLGRISGTACVVSTFRLGKPGGKSRAQRFKEIVIHEVGHTFGLPHCKTPRCVMNDAEGSIKAVDNSTGKLCRSCRLKL